MSDPKTVVAGDILVDEAEEAMEHFLASFDPRKNKLNFLLLAIPVALYANFTHQGGLAFIFSMVAIMPLAFLMGKATEEIALRTGEAVGGLLNATFGNAVEMIIAGLALYTASKNEEIAETMITVTQASLIARFSETFCWFWAWPWFGVE